MNNGKTTPATSQPQCGSPTTPPKATSSPNGCSHSPSTPRAVYRVPVPSDRAKALRPESLRLLTCFGLGRIGAKPHMIQSLPTIPTLQHPQQLVICGPSGSGKTTILPEVIASFDTPQCLAHPDWDPNVPIIDRYPLPPAKAARLLTSVGLTDAISWARLPSELSVGQQSRLRIADALATPEGIIVIDDWCEGLDEITASAVAQTTLRALQRAGRSAVLVTPRADLAQELEPSIVVWCDWSANASVEHHPERDQAPLALRNLHTNQGSLRDYKKLDHLHYAAGSPTQIHSTWTIKRQPSDEVVAVAVLTYPDLHNPARDLATDDRYRRPQRPEVARRLNREVLRFARIVVTPELRGLGLAQSIIRHAIHNTHALYYECSTAMARYTDFLLAAGFNEAPRRQGDAEAELADWWKQCDIPDDVLLDSDRFLTAVDELPVRRARKGRQLIWTTYHRHVLHRRTQRQRPRQVPNRSDPRWYDAAAFVTRRLHDRPLYFIKPIPDRIARIDAPDQQPTNPQPQETHP